MFTQISLTIQENNDKVQIFKCGDVTAIITTFHTTNISMIALQRADGRNGQHIVAGAMDGNSVPTLLKHFVKSL